MTMRKLLLAGAALACAVSVSADSLAKTLRYAEFGPNRGTRAEALNWFADELKKRSDGSLEIEFHWGGSLLGAKAALQGIGAGAADMGSIIGFFTPKKLRGYNIGDLPVENSDEWVGMRALYRLLTEHPKLQKEFDKLNLVYVTNYTTGPIQLICTKKVASLDDLKDTKTRASGPYGKALADIGAVVQRMSQAKVYQALDSGLVTCNQNYYYSMRAYKQYEVASWVTELDWGQNMAFGIAMNKNTWASLSDDHKKVVRSTASDFIDHFAKLMIEGKKANKEAMQEGIDGHKITVVRLPDDQRQKLIEASKKYIQAWIEAATEQGYDGKQIFETYQSHIRKYASEKDGKGYPWTR